MPLILKNLQFDIEKATISGTISDPYWCDTYNGGLSRGLLWSVDVDAKGQEVDGEFWQPRIYHESLQFPIRHWMDLAGQSVRWNTPFNEATGEPNGGVYVFGHEDIVWATLSFLHREGNTFQLHWEGACNIFWNDEYGETVPFSLDAMASFTGIRVLGSEADNDETMRERLALYLDPDDFIQRPIETTGNQYESGVEMIQTLFEPRL